MPFCFSFYPIFLSYPLSISVSLTFLLAFSFTLSLPASHNKPFTCQILHLILSRFYSLLPLHCLFFSVSLTHFLYQFLSISFSLFLTLLIFLFALHLLSQPPTLFTYPHTFSFPLLTLLTLSSSLPSYSLLVSHSLLSFLNLLLIPFLAFTFLSPPLTMRLIAFSAFSRFYVALNTLLTYVCLPIPPFFRLLSPPLSLSHIFTLTFTLTPFLSLSGLS